MLLFEVNDCRIYLMYKVKNRPRTTSSIDDSTVEISL